jgi:hypothetical protein
MSTDSTGTTDDGGGAVDGLVSQLRVIEDQPLDSRAAAFAQLHDKLQRTLEGGDSAQRHA